ncbi:MAG: pentapeptide repeat-containing protein, partial [Candidatus Buchananbacteria bacterium]
GLFSFDGRQGDFTKTQWQNVDFGGGSGYDADFAGADLSQARIESCDLSGVNFSLTKIDGIKIIDPVSLKNLVIAKNQIPDLIKGIELIRPKEFESQVKELGEQEALEKYFEIVII